MGKQPAGEDPVRKAAGGEAGPDRQGLGELDAEVLKEVDIAGFFEDVVGGWGGDHAYGWNTR